MKSRKVNSPGFFFISCGSLQYLRGKNTPVPAHSLLTTAVPPPHRPPDPPRTGLAMTPFGSWWRRWFSTGSGGHGEWRNPAGRPPPQRPPPPATLWRNCWCLINSSLSVLHIAQLEWWWWEGGGPRGRGAPTRPLFAKTLSPTLFIFIFILATWPAAA